jgi:hypothetical protein
MYTYTHKLLYIRGNQPDAPEHQMPFLYQTVLFDIFVNCGSSSGHFMPVLAGGK